MEPSPTRSPRPPKSLRRQIATWGGFLALCTAPAVIGFSQYQPQEDVAACYMLPIEQVDELLGSEPGYVKDEIDDTSCVWEFEDEDAPGPDAGLTLRSYVSDALDGQLRERNIDRDRERVVEGDLTSVEGVGTFATWDPRRQSLEWYDSERLYILRLSGFVARSDAETVDTAKELAAMAMENTETAMDLSGDRR